MRLIYRCCVLFTVVVAGCHRAPVQNEPEPVTGEPPSAMPSLPKVSTTDSWSIRPSSQQHRYRSTTVSIVTAPDVVPVLRDSTSSTADFSLSVSRDTKGASYSAIIETLSVSGGARVSGSAVIALSFPVTLAGRFDPGQLTTISVPECGTAASSAVPIIQRSIALFPLQLRRGQTWTDSTSSTVCSGSIPVTLTALRSYRVIGETDTGGRSGILLERQDRTLSTGEGSEGQHRVQLKGEGAGQSQILIDSDTGVLIETTGTNTTTLTVTTSGRSQRFTQTSREHVVER